MGKCLFLISEVLPLLEHAKKATEHRKLFEQSPDPGLHFVHDQGVYLMSSGLPIQKNGKKTVLAYADGCNPDRDEDWWDSARDLVGGDDFVELLPLQDVLDLITPAVERKWKWFYVEIRGEQMTYGALKG